MDFKELPKKVRKIFQEWNCNASFRFDEIISPLETKNFRFVIRSNIEIYKTDKLTSSLLNEGYVVVSLRQITYSDNEYRALITLRYDDDYNINKEIIWEKRKITRRQNGWVMI